MKLNLILAIMLSVALWTANFYEKRAGEAEQKLRLSQTRNNQLITRIRRLYDEKIILEQNNALLEEEAKKDIPVFDWNTDISHTYVIRRLQSQ